ncbi:MAG: arylsulfatase [Cyclobacteriaceae bacterium]
MIRNFNKFKFSTPFSIALITIVFFGSCSSEREGTGTPKNPNIIIILADDMGYGDVSALNPDSKVSTPSIDKMVREGISFTNAHSSASVCTPSRYGLLTGRYAFKSEEAAFGIGGFAGPVIESGRETLASLLKTSGYVTGVVGKWHLGLEWKTEDGESTPVFNAETGYSNVDFGQEIGTGPNDFGFDYSFIHPASLDIPPYVFLRNHRAIDSDMILTTEVYPRRKDHTTFSWDKKHSNEQAVYWEKGVWWRQGEMSRSFRIENCHKEIVKEGLNFIETQVKNEPDKPFFLYLPLTGPHTPWVPTEDLKGKSPIGLYGDFVMTIDHAVAEIQETLIKNGIDKETLLVFTSDNGAYWPEEEIRLHSHDSNWGRRGQKGDVWEGGHRVPLIITWPDKIKNPSVFKPLVSLLDFFATFSELVGHEKNAGSGEDSFSFLHVLEGNHDKPVRSSMVHHSSGGMYSLRDEKYKYIDGLGSGGFTAPQFEKPQQDGPMGQLYRIDLDSTESQNLILEEPDLAIKMSQSLTSFQ